ncbi:MAG: hypothetical protein COT71_02325 [Candidatus Andersenbacteria bacterium CG10_big_fil_rev_8_21_14_0_10_54_11]|uniref:Uncharacterized protein n=1 Tax=Candidatus Andersenbacteria bacterium CG10_big_fil_rev_8_21_14_0_10_54_11 TaxID=1974485 RepID=A0A2M6WZD3_9BACT|nr:MAG: hypothetical protein COT71_02325 [Candidatus Andersenbacteria bacterium CG10_big_fil_rev_8_21_14_0_10_54_11]
MSTPSSRIRLTLFGSVALMLIVIGGLMAYTRSSPDGKTVPYVEPPPPPRPADFHGRDYIPLGKNIPDLEVTIAPEKPAGK